MTISRLYASSGSVDGLRAMIARFYARPSVDDVTVDDGKVALSGRLIDGVMVECRRGRWRFGAC